VRLFVPALVLIGGLPLAAQMGGGGGMPFFPWWEGPLAQNLNLTEDQNAKIRQVLSETRNDIIRSRAAVEVAEGELGDLMNSDTIDTARGEKITEKLVSARGDLTRNVTLMSIRLRAILTADQWRELQKKQRDFRGPGFRGRRPPSEGYSGRPRPPQREE